MAAAFPGHPAVYLADPRALTRHEILCVDAEAPQRSLRARAADFWIVENNVTTGNFLFEEMLDQCDDDGLLMS